MGFWCGRGSWIIHFFLNEIKSLSSIKMVSRHVVRSANDVVDMLARKGVLSDDSVVIPI